MRSRTATTTATTTTPSSSTIQRCDRSPAGGVPSAGLARGRRVGRLLVGVHGRRSITRRPAVGGSRAGVSRPPGSMGTVVERRHLRLLRDPRPLGRTATTPTTQRSSPPTATRSTPPSSTATSPATTASTHAEHSVSEEAYEAWVRSRLRDLTGACGVRSGTRGGADRRPAGVGPGPRWSPTPRRRRRSRSLRDAGLTVGVCSNWGWELDAFLDQVGLLDLVDSGVTSARAGARKPHPDIYACSIEALGVDPARGRLRRRLVGARRPRARGGSA